MRNCYKPMKKNHLNQNKFCCICGLPVDLRRKEAAELAEYYKQQIKNSEYRYICSYKCSDQLLIKTKADQ